MNNTHILPVGDPASEDEALLWACLRHDDVDVNALALLGERLHGAGKREAALAAFERAASISPGARVLWHAVAGLRLELNRPHAALLACNAALELDPRDAASLFNAAVVMEALGLSEPALHTYKKVLAVDSKHFGALTNRSICLMRLGWIEEAIEAAGEAVRISSARADLWFNLGDTYTSAGRHCEAREAYAKALVLSPEMNKAEVALMVSEAALGQLAAASFRLTALREKNPEALLRFSSPLRADAFAAYPELEPGRIALVAAYAGSRGGDWLCRERLTLLFQRVVDGDGCRPLDNPDLLFLGIGLPISGEYRLRAATQVAGRIARECPSRSLQRRRASDAGRIKIGYVSGDFRQHPTAYLVCRLFEEHDRSRFQVFAYSIGPADESLYRQRVMNGADVFVDASSYAPHILAQRIVRDGIDILIDLQGYTLYAKTATFSLRPAPVQVAYLVYLSTLGAPWIDYAMLDRQVLTPDERRWWAEHIAYLPDTLYLCDDTQMASGANARVSCGLPADKFVYCCLNAPWKISPEDFSLWMRILEAVPDSVLWLYADTPDSVQNFRAHADDFGLARDRLFFAPKVLHAEHLQRFSAADLFLDTHLCNGHTTTIEALACGLPVITWPGESVVARVGASLLHAHGLSELVVDSEDAYIELAIRLGTDAMLLHRVKKIAVDRRGSKLFSTRRRVQDIERAYEWMWARYKKGLPPVDFDVPEIS